MDSELVRSWLQRRVRTTRAWALVTMFFCLFAGLAVLFVSFWITYAVIWFLSFSFYRLSHNFILLLAGGFMALVVVVGTRQNREKLEPLQRQVDLAQDMDITLTPYNRYGMSYNTNAMKAGAFEIRSMASLVNYILCGGVLLLISSVGKIRQFRRLGRINIDACAPVIHLLYAAGKKQSFAEIMDRLPGLDPAQTFEHLHCIDGVLFLSGQGLTLHPDLRSELSHL